MIESPDYEEPPEQTRLPKYWGLREWLLVFAQSNPPGTLVPSERRLSDEFDMSRTTVRKAIQELMVEGWLTRVHGRGNIVAQPKVAHRLRLLSADDWTDRHHTASTRLVFAGIVAATNEIAAQLRIEPGDDVVKIERRRMVNLEPMAIDVNFLSAQRFPDAAEMLSHHESLYATLASEYNVGPAYADETVEAGVATPREAKILATEVGSPLLVLTRQAYDDHDEPIEWARSVFRGDRYKFITRLTR